MGDRRAADARRCAGLPQVRVCDESLAAWASDTSPDNVPDLPRLADLATELMMSPSAACFAETEQIPLEEAGGRIAAEILSPYPPGIPRIIPGERFTDALVEFYRLGVEASMYVEDAIDSTLETVRVVR
jgi:arginine decarboxylase